MNAKLNKIVLKKKPLHLTIFSCETAFNSKYLKEFRIYEQGLYMWLNFSDIWHAR